MRLGRKAGAAIEGSSMEAGTAEAANVKEKKPRAKRPYVIFRFDGHAYHRVGTVNARSRDDALDQYTNPAEMTATELMSGALMVVPEKYTRLVRPEVEKRVSVSYADVTEKEMVGNGGPAGT